MSRFRSWAAGLAFPQSLLLPSVAAGVLAGGWLGLPGVRWASGLGMLVAGTVAWTGVEYLLHRFILHRVEPFRRWHVQHHRQADVPMRTPLLFSLALVSMLVILPMVSGLEAGAAMAFSVGLLMGHLAQEAVHHAMHPAFRPAGGWLGQRQRLHTFHHHADASMAFGTLTGFWDRCLGTAPRRDQMR